MLFLFNIVATTIDAGPPTVRQFGQSGTGRTGPAGAGKSEVSQRFTVRISSSSEANRLSENIAIIPDKLIRTPVLFFGRSPEWAAVAHRVTTIDTSWFAAYLQGHTQSVSLYDSSRRKVLSKPLPNNMGVFQGSALGPLLFTVLSNDLSLYAEDAVTVQYADDTQILLSGPRNDLGALISRMEASLVSLNAWFNANALKVNATKTQLMVFGSRQNLRYLPDIKISFRDAELQPTWARIRDTQYLCSKFWQ